MQDTAISERLLNAACLGAHLLQVISIDDDIEATKLSQPELVLIHTSIADLLPGAWAVGFAGSLNSRLELVQPHQAAGQTAIVGNVGKQDPGCLIQPLVKDPVSNTLQCMRSYYSTVGMGLTLQDITCLFKQAAVDS